jgi:hypothetical protein
MPFVAEDCAALLQVGNFAVWINNDTEYEVNVRAVTDLLQDDAARRRLPFMIWRDASVQHFQVRPGYLPTVPHLIEGSRSTDSTAPVLRRTPATTTARGSPLSACPSAARQMPSRCSRTAAWSPRTLSCRCACPCCLRMLEAAQVIPLRLMDACKGVEAAGSAAARCIL